VADYIVEGPDGKKYRVTADTPEAVDAAVQELYGSGAAPAPTGGAMAPPGAAAAASVGPAPPPPTLVERIMSGAKTALGIADQGVRGAAEGMANIVGLPGDIGKATGRGMGPVAMVGGIPFPTSDAIKAIPNKLNDWTAGLLGVEAPRQKPEGLGERIAHRVGEEVGAMAVPAGGAVRAGASLGPAAARAAIPEGTGTNVIGRIADFFKQAPAKMVESAAVNPANFVGKEVAAATAAGTGAGLVNEVTGKSAAEARGEKPTGLQQAGDVAGAVTGVGTAALGKKVVDVGGHVVGAMTGNTGTTNKVVRDVATDEIARFANVAPGKDGVIDTDPLVAQIMNGRKVDETIPRFQESTADRTKNPGLAAAEYSRQSGPNSGQYAARRDANTAAIDDAMKTSEPQATPGALSSELEIERQRRLTDAGVNTANATDEANNLTRTLTPGGTPAGRGSTVRNELETARDTTRQATADAYERAGINDNPLAPTTLAEGLDRVTASLPRADRVDTPQGLIDQIAQIPAGEAITIREASALKTRLLGLQEKAAAEPGGRNTVRVLGQYIDAVEEVIQGGITAEQRAALGEARGLRRAEGTAFERKGDPVADILSVRPGGTPRMRDENVANLSVRTDALDRILQQADTPATRAAIRDQLLSNADTATAEGIQRFTQEYSQQLQRFPGMADELGRAQTARGAQATAQATETELMREIGPQGRGVVARYLQYGDENASKAMRGVIASKDPARAADELLRFVNDDPKAVEGARKVFWDIMQEKTRSGGSTTKTISGSQPYLPGALRRFVDDPAVAAVAERLYRDNPEHWQNVKKITEAMQGVDVRNSAKAPNTSGTPQGMQPGYLPSGETLASRIFAVERGVVSPAFAAINIAGIIARKAVKQAHTAAVDKAIDKALLDPEWAALLLKENNPANRAALARSAKGWLGNETSTLIDMLGPEDKDRETKKAVMKP